MNLTKRELKEPTWVSKEEFEAELNLTKRELKATAPGKGGPGQHVVLWNLTKRELKDYTALATISELSPYG